MKIKHENKQRAEEYLIRQLNFNKIGNDLLKHNIITPNELISNSNYLRSQGNKEHGNNVVMRSLVDRFITSDERTALIIEILQNSGAYRTEAFHLNEYLECQKSNASFWAFTKRAYHFPPHYTKTLLEDELEDFEILHDNITPPTINEEIIEERRNVPPHHIFHASDENMSCCQETEKNKDELEKGTIHNVPESTTNVPFSDTFGSTKVDDASFTCIQQNTDINDEVNSIITSMDEVVVTPMEESDEKIAAVFHQVTDYEDMSDKSNVDEVKVYDIAKKIGIPTKKIKGRIQTNRIGKAKKQTTRPLKVTFKDEQTRDSFLKMAKAKSNILEDINIVPFVKNKRHPFQFWKKNNYEKPSNYRRW